MPLEAAKDYAGAIVAGISAIVAAAWVWIVMFFGTRSEVARAHTRIDSLDRKVDDGYQRLMDELKAYEARLAARDTRIEDKLDRLIERGTPGQ